MSECDLKLSKQMLCYVFRMQKDSKDSGNKVWTVIFFFPTGFSSFEVQNPLLKDAALSSSGRKVIPFIGLSPEVCLTPENSSSTFFSLKHISSSHFFFFLLLS